MNRKRSRALRWSTFRRMAMSPPLLVWNCADWSALDRDALYDALTLRLLVFVVEQACIYLDCDGRDRRSTHLLGRRATGELVAYARLLPPGVSFTEMSIGRVATHPS